MSQVSVVIIIKNESHNVIDCIVSAKKISADIIVIDTGSTDTTVALAKQTNAKVETILWQGYGHARNTGASLAYNNWIFSLDADERITDELAKAVNDIAFKNERAVYGFSRINYFSNKKMRYGSFAHDRVFRLYNRHYTQWNSFPVHEKLTGKSIQKIKSRTSLVHFTAANETDYLQKITHYASLCALKYKQEGKRFAQARMLLSPVFSFIKDYVFQVGFLDKQPGFIIAKLHAVYTWKKYQQLKFLQSQEKRQLQKINFLHNSLRRISSFFS